MTAAALLDLEIDWLLPGKGGDLLGCAVTAEALEDKLKGQPYMAVWLTSPDYLGRRVDLRYVPEILFELDTNIEYAAHINQLLKETQRNGETGDD